MSSLIDMIKRALKKGDLCMKIVCYFQILLGYSNHELQALQIRNKKYNKLKNKYCGYLDGLHYENDSNNEINNNVWICWFQGMENAPEIVKACNDSVCKFLMNKDIHIITENNYKEYVSIPEFIEEKRKKGVISYAHFSDILRTELLIKYGGMWLDATTYLTDPIPDYVYSRKLFLLAYKQREDVTINKNSWFIYAQPSNRSLMLVRDLLYKYWNQENKLSEYFLWHMFLNMALEKYPEDNEDIYYVSEEMSHCLNYNLYKQFDPEYWQQIKRCSTIHKLSYYYFYTKDGNFPDDYSGTYYDYIINKKV